MALPTTPTRISLVHEALKKVGMMEDMGRALNSWMEEIKNDIWLNVKNSKSLQAKSVRMMTVGLSRYSRPDDYDSDMTLTRIFGQNTGTAQGGSISSITLAADDTMTEDFARGREILVTSGTGERSISQITGLSSSVASVSPDFATAPVADDNYMTIDEQFPIQLETDWDLAKIRDPYRTGPPTQYHPRGNESNMGEFYLYPVPDKSYGMVMSYYVNLALADLTSTRLASVYTKWRNVWLSGITAKATQKVEDLRNYNTYLRKLVSKNNYGNDLQLLQVVSIDD